MGDEGKENCGIYVYKVMRQVYSDAGIFSNDVNH